MTINTTGYTLVFDPSFSSLSLESSSNPNGTWDTTYPYATPGSANFSGRTLSSNDEAEFYSDSTVGVNPFSVSNGVMTITAAAATAAEKATEAAANNGASLPYTSGLLTTDTSFAQTYGLYEITAKLPAGQGLWPALWLLPASGAWPPEIDILEALGNAPNTDYMTLHTGTGNTTEGSTTQVPTATTAFNTYAVDWEPTTITFYVNGQQVFQEATPADMHQPMYLLMNLAVGGTGSWPGPPNSSTVFPAQMQISSVEVYASPNTITDYNKVGVQTTTTAPPPPTDLPPVAVQDYFTGAQNHALTGNVLANNGGGVDSDPNGLALSVTAATITTAHGGTVVLAASGSFTYTPAAGFAGTDTFTYTLQDSAGLTATGPATITVNAPPSALPDSFTGAENKVITGNVMTNDNDPNGLSLSVVAATITTAHGGTVVQNANGTFTYTPATNFVGTDTYNYTLNDTAGLTATGTVTLTVTAPIDMPPVAVQDYFTGAQNHALTGNVLANNGGGVDSDPNGLILSVTAGTITTAHGGSVVLAANGAFTYTPASGFSGTDTFNYTLKDSAGLTATGPATITVNAPPTALPDSFTGAENKPITGNVMTNDNDPNGLALSVVAATIKTAHGGTVVQNANGTFTYTPATNFVGTDSYNYTLEDTANLTAIGTVAFTVTAAASTAPVTKTDDFTSSENDPMFGNVLANNGNGADTDPNGLGLSIANATLRTAHGGAVTENSDGTITYIPAANFVGTDSFSYTLKDSAGHTSTGTVDITVEPVSNTVTFGPGSNMLFGAAGSDTFVFKAANLGTGVDTIRNFSVAENDKIDISNVLSGHYNPATEALSNFVNVVTSGSNSIVEVDLTGHAGASGWTQVVTVFDVTGLNEQSLVQHGNLIV
jgi:beta-glucanase (GH16 family)